MGQPTGLGAGAGLRREDACVMIATTPEEETSKLPIPDELLERHEDEAAGLPGKTQRCWQLPDPDCSQVTDVLEDGAEWTAESSSEEVLEAMRRVLLAIGVKIGAKTCDLIIKLLHHPSFSIDAFKTGISSHRGLRDDADKQLEQTLTSLRFKKEMVRDNGEEHAEAPMWVRDPLDVVRRQVAQLSFHDDEDVDKIPALNSMRLNPFEQVGDNLVDRVYSHPLSTSLAASVHRRVRSSVMDACARGQEGVGGWEDGHDFVLLLQFYSDKSSQTLKTSSHTHFPLHVSVLNTSLTMKEKLVTQGDGVIGYLPTSIFWESEEANMFNMDMEDAVSGRGNRCSRLRILQEGLRTCMDPLLSLTLKGFEVHDSTGMPKQCHPVLWSYVTDLPEGWDVSSGVHSRCSRCEVKKEDLCSTEPCRCKDAFTIISDFDGLERRQTQRNVKILREAMWERGIAPVRPYLLSLRDNFGVDVFQCLRYELMHNIHLGLTRTILECMSERLRSTSLVSTEFAYASKPYTEKKFAAIRTSVLRALNNSMELMDRQSPTIDFKVSFKSNKRTNTLNGLFQDKGLASMLEARDYARVLQMMPFLGATVDRMCGEPGTITSIFVQYVDLVYMMTRKNLPSAAFSALDIRVIKQNIRKFVNAAQTLFAEYQKSDMAIPKVHALLHAADDIAKAGALAHYRADAYEASHKNMKAAYNAGSRRGDDGHEEALAMIQRADFLRMATGRTDRGARIDVVERLSRPPKRTRGARTMNKEEAVQLDSVALTRGRQVLRASVILRFEKHYRGNGCLTRSLGWPSWVPKEVRELCADLGGPRPFVWFMQRLKLGPQDSLLRTNSAYISGHPFPIPERSAGGETMLISVDRKGEGDMSEEEVPREVQRVVAAHRFHNSKHPFQNFVMVEAQHDEDDPMGRKLQLHFSAEQKYASCTWRPVWIAKVLALLTVRRKEVVAVGDVPTGQSSTTEYALVQYLDVCQEKPDPVDQALGCAKLRWAQEVDNEDVEEHMDSMRCFYDIVDAGTIRGLVHVVRGDYGLGCTSSYKCEGDRHWSKCWFYLNRFKLPR